MQELPNFRLPASLESFLGMPVFRALGKCKEEDCQMLISVHMACWPQQACCDEFSFKFAKYMNDHPNCLKILVGLPVLSSDTHAALSNRDVRQGAFR